MHNDYTAAAFLTRHRRYHEQATALDAKQIAELLDAKFRGTKILSNFQLCGYVFMAHQN